MAFFVSRPVSIPTVTFGRPTNLRSDVYSYNFPDDKRYLKALGGFLGLICILTQLIEECWSAYFIFLAETVQTALTGADVYYWFMAGFGDPSRLKKSNFSAIDSPTADAIISFIVQGFFCYRIWTLNKKVWWLALIIAIVRMFSFAAPVVCLLRHEACCDTSVWGGMGWDQGMRRTDLHQDQI
jgi:hypothetical protein